MLHDSPRSSRLHLPTMAALADRFTVFAIDTPGYGNSAPLSGAAPTIGDFAKALGATLAKLGLTQAPLYATHTSAKIALAYASQQSTLPLLVLDGLSMPESMADESFIARYMRPFQPDASGAYLAGEWTRIRDMLRWFPWFSQTPEHRFAQDMPDPAWMLDYTIDLFSAGPHYADAYAAAMRYDPMPALACIATPTVVAARTDDVLHPYLQRASTCGNPMVTTRSIPADRETWLAWLHDTLAPHAIKAPTPPPPAGARRYTDHPHGLLHWTISGTGAPWVVLSAPTTLHAHHWAAALQGTCYVPDLPGFGDSDPCQHAETIARTLADGLHQQGLRSAKVLAVGLAALLAAMLAAYFQIDVLVVDGMPPLEQILRQEWTEKLAPAIAFDPQAGHHLHRIWHILRDGEAQWPWCNDQRAAIRKLPPLLDADGLHIALTGMLKHMDNWGDSALAALACDESIWRAVAAPVLVFAPADPAYAQAEWLGAACGARIINRPDTLADAAVALQEAL